MSAFRVRLNFHGNLAFFLKPNQRNRSIEIERTEKSSVKDLIESCRIPHPEVDLILVNGAPVDFAKTIDSAADIEVYPVEQCPTLFAEQRLQVRRITQFIADGHLGKLVRDLRLLGFDVLYDRHAQDRQLLELATGSQRGLLTRDRRLLMHAVVQRGYYLRSQNPLEQTGEIIRRFDLFSAIDPFTRCLRCNAQLEKAEKSSVTEKLEPLTRLYYDQFRRCTGCGQVYWTGSHFSKLERRIETIRMRCCRD